MTQVHVSLPAETVLHFFSLPITNSLLVNWIVMILLVVFAIFATRKITNAPKGLQNFAETIIEGLYNFFEGIVGEKVKIFFPLVATFFLFILLANWFGLIPGVGSIGIFEEKEGEKVLVPLLRGGTADLNTTLALAIFSVSAIQYFGLKHLKLSYLTKFINLKGPIDFFVGVLELISEFAKVISFSFRLFGNIFAGEVLLVVIGFLIPVIIPLPFIFMEIFVGFIQAFIFSVLSLVFLNVATAKHEH